MVFLGGMSCTRGSFEGGILEPTCGEWTAGCLCGIGMMSIRLKNGPKTSTYSISVFVTCGLHKDQWRGPAGY